LKTMAAVRSGANISGKLPGMDPSPSHPSSPLPSS